MNRLSAAAVVALVAVLAMAGASPAHAYLDPGSGAIMLQAILGAFLAVGVTARIYWKRIRDGFRALFGKGAKQANGGEPPES